MKDRHFFDKPENVKRSLVGFYVFLVLLIVVDLILPKHSFFPWEGYPSFYGAFGFFAYTSIVFVSGYILRKIVMRKEDYYD
jgi:NADH:ubiquinone oxidoreductase subunit 3 (subunit A)